MSKLEILPLSQEDIDGVLEVDKLSFSNPWLKESYEKELKNKIAKYFVAKNGTKILGFIGLWIILDECQIINVAVHPNFRGLGIGKFLMDKTISTCSEHNVQGITLEVRESNSPAKNLYYKYGFKDTSIRENYYNNPKENAIIMWKKDF